MRTVSAVVVVALSGCWHGGTQPATPSRPTPPPAPTASSGSYRAITVAVDAVGVAAMATGLIGLERGYNDDVSGGLYSVGLGVASFGGPLVHLAHGRTGRAGGSYGIRALTITTGWMVGYGVGCIGDRDILCGLEGMFWGAAGGLAAGAVLDAVLLHDDSAERPTWSPAVTHTDGTTRVGIAGAF